MSPRSGKGGSATSGGRRTRPRPGRRRRRRPTWLLAPLVLVALLAAMLTRGGDAPPTTSNAPATSPTPTPTPTPASAATASTAPEEASLDVSALTVPRAEFCALLPETDVEQALGGAVTGTAHYGNGDEVEFAPGQVDVSHEFGCVFEGSDATARAWVFARPVTVDEAQTLVRRARGSGDCDFPDSIGFGEPMLASVCTGEETRARLEGLFTDTWVACEVSGGQATAALLGRTEQWCTEVVTAAAAAG